MREETLSERLWALAGMMSEAHTLVPQFLIGDVDACFAVCSLAARLGIPPMQAARQSYLSPSGDLMLAGKVARAGTRQ